MRGSASKENFAEFGNKLLAPRISSNGSRMQHANRMSVNRRIPSESCLS